jgi:hypothetical protein
MLKFIPRLESGTLKGYHVFRNGIKTGLSPCNIFENHGTVGDCQFSTMITKEAIALLNYETQKKLTPKEEKQLFNFYCYGKTNPTKANKLLVKIQKTEQTLKALKEQLERECKGS